ncbi:MAG: DUF4349 domain-containing protein [Saccharofermentanales bacterium]
MKTNSDSSVLSSVHVTSHHYLRIVTIILVLVISAAMILSACGSSSGTSTATTTAGTTAAGAPGFDKGAGDEAGQPGIPSPTETGSNGRPTGQPVKIIRNARLDLEADNGEQAYQTLLKFATERGGYEASRQLSTSGGYAVIEARIKLAPQYLDEFLNFAGTTAKVINESTSSQDVTESYYDVQTRLKTMEQMLAKYTDFLDDAQNITEALAVQAEINRLTTEIESLKGRLRYYDSMVAESTITLLIRETRDPVKTTRELKWNALTLEDMAYLMQRGLLTVANTLANIGQWLLIAIVAISPLLIIALIVLLILRRRRRAARELEKNSGKISKGKNPNDDVGSENDDRRLPPKDDEQL